MPNVIPKDHYNSKLTWSEHLECRWRGSVQRSSPQTLEELMATKVRLEKCDLRLYTLTKLAHSLPRRLEKVTKKEAILWLLIFLLINIKWIRNNITNLKKKAKIKRSELTFATPWWSFYFFGIYLYKPTVSLPPKESTSSRNETSKVYEISKWGSGSSIFLKSSLFRQLLMPRFFTY